MPSSLWRDAKGDWKQPVCGYSSCYECRSVYRCPCQMAEYYPPSGVLVCLTQQRRRSLLISIPGWVVRNHVYFLIPGCPMLQVFVHAVMYEYRKRLYVKYKVKLVVYLCYPVSSYLRVQSSLQV